MKACHAQNTVKVLISSKTLLILFDASSNNLSMGRCIFSLVVQAGPYLPKLGSRAGVIRWMESIYRINDGVICSRRETALSTPVQSFQKIKDPKKTHSLEHTRWMFWASRKHKVICQKTINLELAHWTFRASITSKVHLPRKEKQP